MVTIYITLNYGYYIQNFTLHYGYYIHTIYRYAYPQCTW